MYGFFNHAVEIYKQVDTQQVGTGFLDGWESQGIFDCSIAEAWNTVLSLGQQVSYYSNYRITLPENPGVYYKATRFLVVEGKHAGKWLEPEGDPKEFGDYYNTTTVVECVEITDVVGQPTRDTEDSVNSPPVEVVYVEDSFTGDGLNMVFVLSEEITPGTSEVVVDHAYKLAGVDYTEQTDRIVFGWPPPVGAAVSVKALPA